jgi:hypothetical protein
MTARVKTGLALVLGLVAALLVFAVLLTPAEGHRAPKPHGHRYYSNYAPTGYYALYEPGGTRYLGDDAVADAERGYTAYRKVKVNGRYFYKLHAYYRWVGADGKVYTATRTHYAALHKFEDYGSDRPGFRVYMTSKATGRHYWRRFEARGSKPPNAVIVSGPRYEEAGSVMLVYFGLFSPDPTARFQYKATTKATLPQTWAAGQGKNGKTAEIVITNPEKVVGHGMKVRAIDPAGRVDKTPAWASFPPGPEYL